MEILLILIAVGIIFGIGAAVEYENGFLALVGTVAVLALGGWMLSINPIDFVVHNYGQIILGFIGWFVVGAVTSYAKWAFYVKRSYIIEKVKDAYAIHKKRLENGPTYVDNVDFEKSYNNPLNLGKNAARIMGWIVFWPSVIVWALTYRLIEKAARFVYETLKGLYASIASSAIKKAINE